MRYRRGCRWFYLCRFFLCFGSAKFAAPVTHLDPGLAAPRVGQRHGAAAPRMGQTQLVGGRRRRYLPCPEAPAILQSGVRKPPSAFRGPEKHRFHAVSIGFCSGLVVFNHSLFGSRHGRQNIGEPCYSGRDGFQSGLLGQPTPVLVRRPGRKIYPKHFSGANGTLFRMTQKAARASLAASAPWAHMALVLLFFRSYQDRACWQ